MERGRGRGSGWVQGWGWGRGRECERGWGWWWHRGLTIEVPVEVNGEVHLRPHTIAHHAFRPECSNTATLHRHSIVAASARESKAPATMAVVILRSLTFLVFFQYKKRTRDTSRCAHRSASYSCKCNTPPGGFCVNGCRGKNHCLSFCDQKDSGLSWEKLFGIRSTSRVLHLLALPCLLRYACRMTSANCSTVETMYTKTL